MDESTLENGPGRPAPRNQIVLALKLLLVAGLVGGALYFLDRAINS